MSILCSISVYAYEKESDDSYLQPHDSHYALLYLVQDALPTMHFSKKPIDYALGQAIADRIIAQLNDFNITYSQIEKCQLKEESSPIASAIKGVDLDLLFSLVDTVYERGIQFAEGSLQFASNLSEESLNKHIVYEMDGLEKGLPEPINSSHSRELMNRVIATKIAYKTTSGMSFELAKKSVVSALEEKHILLAAQRTADRYFDIVLQSLLYAYDSHSRFVTPSHLKMIKSSRKNHEYRVGLDINKQGDVLFISGIVEGSMAQLSGQFIIGDTIEAISINGKRHSLAGRSPHYLSELLLGFGSVEAPIIFYGLRGNDAYRAIVSKGEVKNSAIVINHYASDVHGMGIKHLVISSFFDGLFEQVQRKIKDNGDNPIVIDLRGNGGGSLVEAIELTSLFMDGGVVVTTFDGKGKTVFKDEDDYAYKGKVIVLVDRHSASASEIMASALQYHKRAVIVGEQTFGKGTVQRFIDLSNPAYEIPYEKDRLGALLITIAAYFSPSGDSVQAHGVTPDIIIGGRGKRSIQGSGITPISPSNIFEPKGVDWLSNFQQRLVVSIAKIPLYRFYMNQKGSTDIDQKYAQPTTVKKLHATLQSNRQRTLGYLNFNRRYQNLSPLISVDDIEAQYKVIDVLLDAIALNVKLSQYDVQM